MQTHQHNSSKRVLLPSLQELDCSCHCHLYVLSIHTLINLGEMQNLLKFWPEPDDITHRQRNSILLTSYISQDNYNLLVSHALAKLCFWFVSVNAIMCAWYTLAAHFLMRVSSSFYYRWADVFTQITFSMRVCFYVLKRDEEKRK